MKFRNINQIFVTIHIYNNSLIEDNIKTVNINNNDIVFEIFLYKNDDCVSKIFPKVKNGSQIQLNLYYLH